MEDEEIFEDPLLEEIEKLDNLEKQNELPKEENNIIEPDEILNTTLKEKEEKEKKEKKHPLLRNKEEKKTKIIDDICNNICFIFIIYFINSAISIGTFYLYYKYKISLKDNILLFKIFLGLIFLLIFFNITSTFLSRSKFNKKHETCSNIALFITINIYKIIFEAVLYLLITLDQYHDQIDFPHFEVRAFWKISMCFLYVSPLFLIFL